VSWDSIYGNCIVIAHSQELETFYGHLERVLVAEGDSVNSRDLVGFVGSTGRSSGPHLHFEVRYRGNRLDPAGLFFLK
jgi:murein DD-endopeptidase MepM/ murein hydrolase activator NlpD